MTTLAGFLIADVYGGAQNPSISKDLSGYSVDYWPRHVSDAYLSSFGTLTRNVASANPKSIGGIVERSYFDDLYNRIHINPSTIELGNISTAQQRQANVWNAYLTAETLDQILSQDASGIDVTAPGAYPITFNPLEEKQFDLTVTMRGPASIKATLLFDFSGLANQPTLIVLGSRALTLQSVPDVPLSEKWSWMTDIKTAFDGSEQRIANRRVPRFSETVSVVADTDAAVRDQYAKIMSASGRLFLPWLQNYALLSADAAIGDTSLLFDTARADVRADEYLMILPNDGSASILAQIAAISANGVTLQQALSGAVKRGAAITPAFSCIVSDNTQLGVERAGGMSSLSLDLRVSAPRAQFERPGSAAVLTMFDGLPVLERPAMVDPDENVFTTGQTEFDAKTGLIDVTTDWIFTQVSKSLSFIVKRTADPTDFDYWRKFLNTVLGRFGAFLWSTNQADELLYATISGGATSMTLTGDTFAGLYFPVECFKRLAVTTAAGTAYVTAQSATKDSNGNSSVSFSPPLPSGAGWADVLKISHLLKLRLDSDEVSLSHDVLDTKLSFPVRTIQA